MQTGTKAPQAAGRIHTDFERGFIMAEVMSYPDFKEHESEANCKVRVNFIIIQSGHMVLMVTHLHASSVTATVAKYVRGREFALGQRS